MASTDIIYDVAVIGAGISGITTAKCLLDDRFNIVVYEKTSGIGGLWHFREDAYGVMRFTHINVSKVNYCFSDFPFPYDIQDFPHHSQMLEYVESYAKHFGVIGCIRFNTNVVNIERKEDGLWSVTSVKLDDQGSPMGPAAIVRFKYVAIATGHHAIPNLPSFEGQESFEGKLFHSVDYKDAATNQLIGKKVVVVGIGNSAVDVAVNAVEMGSTKPVYVSSRSGAWVVPNYVAGYPTDHYACRAFLWLPWQLSSLIFGWICRCVFGSPWKWGLNPKMGSLQTQLTVSPTLVHHIQRRNIHIKPNITKLEPKCVSFTDGSKVEADVVVCCTGYSISLPFLSSQIKPHIIEEGTNKLHLYKNVFSPECGSSLAFIGFVQPASGGLLPVSEIQARWFSALCKGIVKLPTKEKMFEDIKKDNCYSQNRYYPSARHTIQQDPILYIDDVASLFDAKPQLWRNPTLAWRLMFGTCGAAQWRLQGPHKWDQAKNVVKNVPVTPLMNCFGFIMVLLPVVLLTFMVCKMCH